MSRLDGWMDAIRGIRYERIIDEPTHKNYDSTMLGEVHPPFCFGGSYVLAARLVRYIVENQRELHKYKAEDVSVGRWLAPLDVHRRNDFRFQWMEHVCFGEMLSKHPVTPAEHTLVREEGNLIDILGRR